MKLKEKIKKFLSLNFIGLVGVLVRKYHRSKISSPELSCFLENLIAFLRKRKVRFSYDRLNKSYCAVEEKFNFNFATKKNGFWLYRDGIQARGEFLFSSYCLNSMSFEEGDVIIDCGANSGDLAFELKNRAPKVRYIGVEPNPEDFKMLRKNVDLETSECVNKALGERNEVLNFYVCTEQADSSLIEPPSYTEIVNVEVVRLDNLCDELDIKKIKLLKLEAEGYEPEVLNGAARVLDCIEYVAVDGSYERNKNTEQTFTWATNFLLKNNFEMVDIYFPWYRALYRKIF